jgi:glycosyltransferase 2 family protein
MLLNLENFHFLKSRAFWPLAAILSIGGLAYVLWSLLQDFQWQDNIFSSDPSLVFKICLRSLIYGGVLFVLAFGWCFIVLVFTNQAMNFWKVMAIYALSQIGKYTPGNIGHFVGRHVLMHREGFGHISIVASAYEMLLLVFTAVIFSVTLGRFEYISSLSSHTNSLTYTTIILACICMIYIWPRVAVSVNLEKNILTRRVHILNGAVAACMVAIFFLSCAAIVHDISAVIYPNSPISYGEMLGVISAAWLLGYVMPGAAGGLGVREAAIVFMLEGSIGGTNAGVLALTWRVITLLGDFAFFLYGLILNTYTKHTNKGFTPNMKK